MTMSGNVRWGILGTGQGARSLATLGSCPRSRREAVAGEHRPPWRPATATGPPSGRPPTGSARPVLGYQSLIEDPEVDALYIPLPNALHGEWTIRALRAGKPVLCEKPLTGSVAETEQVLAVARETGTPAVGGVRFPFHDQMARLSALLAAGAIGELREIQSGFHFFMSHRTATSGCRPAGRRGAQRCRLLPGPPGP